MSGDRWRQLEAVFHEALARPREEREQYLQRACGDDDDLRRQVQSLLAHQADSNGFLESPVPVPVSASPVSREAQWTTGQQVAHYVIGERLGRGGMGEVYRARDTRLDRDVALKVLPPEFAADPPRMARFEREARLLASVSHRNIATIHGIEDADGVLAIAMELVDGTNLAEMIHSAVKRTGQGLPVHQAIAMAAQLANALDAAHERGIIHRDLKPANIMVTRDEDVKVLDFGLGRFVESDAAGPGTAARTLTVEPTRPGIVMGTAAYMSPEQARGLPVDKRTDIWAFGCLLYEMLTGHAAFPGKTFPDILAGVLEREPDWALLPATTPPAICRLLERCLEKDAKRRLRDIGDAAIELADGITSPATVTKPRKQPPRWIWGLAGAVLFVGLALGWTIAHIGPPLVVENRAVTLTVNAPLGTEFGVDTGGAISPDGGTIAFVTGPSGDTKLWIRPLASLIARELPGTDGATFPFWSPDGGSLGFFARGKLKRIEVSAGPPTVICDVGLGRGGTWNEDGLILFNSVNDGPLLRVAATGGTPVPFTTVDKAHGENSHRWPQFLPGGHRFLYFVRTDSPENYGVYLGSLDGPGQKTLLLRAPTNAIYVSNQGAPSGQLLWVRDGTLVAEAFDPEQGHTTGEPVSVAEGVAFGPASRLGAVSASNNGTLLYGGARNRQYQITWFDRDGKELGGIGQPDEYTGLRISPDGKRVASTRSGDVWQIEFARGIPTRVTFGGGVDPLWSPDGERIAYWKGSPPNLFSHNANGTGDDERLVESHDSLGTQDWSPDGRSLLYLVNSNDLSSKAHVDLWVLPMTGARKRVPFLSTPFREGRGQFSPDGKWVAYTSDESGRNEVYVQSFPAAGAKWPVSSMGGDWVRWRRDGREMFYIAADRKLMSVAVQDVAGSLEFGSPRALFTVSVAPVMGGGGNLGSYPYDVMPGGQRFLAMVPAGDATLPPMTVILNWQAELSAGTTLHK